MWRTRCSGFMSSRLLFLTNYELFGRPAVPRRRVSFPWDLAAKIAQTPARDGKARNAVQSRTTTEIGDNNNYNDWKCRLGCRPCDVCGPGSDWERFRRSRVGFREFPNHRHHRRSRSSFFRLHGRPRSRSIEKLNSSGVAERGLTTLKID